MTKYVEILEYLTLFCIMEECFMIDFKEELKKYTPVLGLDDVEQGVKQDDIQDIQQLLQKLVKKIENDEE